MTERLTLGRVAHGGFVVGRADGKVVFVTGGLPGEVVDVEITSTGKRFDRGAVERVVEAHPGRVEPPCPIAGECGGCDWQHADQATQLDLKTAVVAEQLDRLAGVTWDGAVEAVPGGLLGWRTRVRYAVDDLGVVGFRARRSHRVVPLPEGGCRIAAPGPAPEELARVARPGDDLEVTVADDRTVIAPARDAAGQVVHEVVRGRRFTVGAGGFWQVHPRSADVLTSAVLDGLRPKAGETALDLYCGVGLFAGALVDAGCTVTGAEGSRDAVQHARRNVPEATFHQGSIERLHRTLPPRADLVVLDPPRKGAGPDVAQMVAGRRPRAIAYVACDPAALARDLAMFAGLGYTARSIRAFDLFPMTHHVEAVALLER